MKKAGYITYFTSLAMILALTNVFVNGNFAIEGPALFENAWGIMSLVDLFAGLLIFYAWIVFREKHKLVSLALLPLMLFFGFLTASIYILYNIYKSKGDWVKFFLGNRAESYKN